MKNIKYIIIALVILAIIAIVLFLLLSNLKKDNNPDELQISNEGDIGEEVTISNNEEKVANTFEFKIVENCIQQYYNLLMNESDDFLYRDDNGDLIKLSESDINNIRMQLLSKSYLANNNLNNNNLSNSIKSIDVTPEVFALQMKVIYGERINKYAVHGIVVSLDYELIDEFYMYVSLDTINKTFAIEPVNDRNIDFNSMKISDSDTTIESNDYNGYVNVAYGYEQIAKEYLEDYKKIIVASPDLAYNYLDKEYREARFGSLNNFKQYVEKNKEEIKRIIPSEYLVNYEKDYTEYVIKDQYGNFYIFDEKSVSDYTVKLDTYTLEQEKFNTEYNKATNKQKVLMNLDKFFQMLNANDYRSAYALLDDNYKATYFPTEEVFENVVKQYMYPHANTKYMNFSDEISGVFTYYVELTNKANTNDKTIGINVVMQLREGTDFRLSFTIVN